MTNETCENIIFAALNISVGKISSKKTEIELFAKSTDIFVLTEAFFEDKKVFLKDRFIYSSFLNNGRGIVVIIDRKMKILEKDCIVEGRGIYIKVEYNKKTYDIIAIYAPAEASDATIRLMISLGRIGRRRPALASLLNPRLQRQHGWLLISLENGYPSARCQCPRHTSR